MDGLCKLPNLFTPSENFFSPDFVKKCMNDSHSLLLLFPRGSQPPLPSGVDAFISRRGDQQPCLYVGCVEFKAKPMVRPNLPELESMSFGF